MYRRPMPTTIPLGAVLLLGATLVRGVLGSTPTVDTPRTTGEPAPETPRPLEVTSGAAPGYVDDASCAGCHADLAASYRGVGMARSFYPPSEMDVIEDFEGEPYFHDKSQRYYTYRRSDDGGLRFRRWQRDDAGRDINVFETDVEWVIGSGNKSRSYLYRTEAGELYQLPVSWYTENGEWKMSPGFDKERHLGLGRLVRRECMFCHNAYPEQPVKSDTYRAPHRFPDQLPHGIGCQRCHGPGAEHVRQGRAAEIDFPAFLGAILNPADLPPRRQREVCYQCHMQPSVTLMGVRRFGRSTYDYRPGEPLSDYLVQVDVEIEGESKGDRFEINHHPYRLEQSACFVNSPDGALSCMTCHDPHRKVPETERIAHYRQACLSCHTVDACDLERMQRASPEALASLPAVAAEDCAGCHMPKNRPRDVVHTVMTDHLIRRQPGGPELLDPQQESTPIVTDAKLLPMENPPDPVMAEIYRAVTVLRTADDAEATDWLEEMLGKSKVRPFEALVDLGRGKIGQGRHRQAGVALREALSHDPGNPSIIGLLGLSEASLGNRGQAVALLREALTRDPDRASANFNLGRVLLPYEGPAQAIPYLERATSLQQTLAPAWFWLGKAYAALDRKQEAIVALRHGLEAEPSLTDGYFEVASVLLALGDRDEALRFLRHGARVAADKDRIAVTLARVEAQLAQPESTDQR